MSGVVGLAIGKDLRFDCSAIFSMVITKERTDLLTTQDAAFPQPCINIVIVDTKAGEQYLVLVLGERPLR